jgi:hypothetical protein
LRSLRGFYTSYDRNNLFLGVRGFMRPGDFNARVLLLVDGHRLNDNVYGGGSVVSLKFSEEQPQILRLRLPQKARQTLLRMTILW